MRRASETERAQLHETFAALCRIESPSGRERACADWVMAELETMGLEVTEDGSAAAAGSEAGNLLTRVPGRTPATILICAHLDTVPPVAPIEPVLNDGYWENSNAGILGADNKSAVAVALELARRLATAEEPPPIGVEFLFTVCEEVSLRGSRAFDTSVLQSSFGYVFDHATPIGEVVLGSPTHYRIMADFHGRAAHAGVRPEVGRSAIVAAARAISNLRLGRLDSATTANVGQIAGGTAINVVPERCQVVAEVRSLDEKHAAAVTTEAIDHFEDAGDATECDLDLTVERMFQGYRIRSRAPEIQAAERALRACGYEPRHIDSGGASDANSFRTAGFPCACLADGTEHNHEPGERISTAALESLLDLALVLIDESATELEVAPA